jgi:hypothetical protein
MPKYKVTYYEKYEAVVEAENEKRAKEIADCATSVYVGCEDGDVIEVGGSSPPKDEPKVWERYLKKLLDR